MTGSRTESPTMELRWVRTAEKGPYSLQQAFLVRDVDPADSYVTKQTKEWRFIPVVIVADAPKPPRAEREADA